MVLKEQFISYIFFKKILLLHFSILKLYSTVKIFQTTWLKDSQAEGLNLKS